MTLAIMNHSVGCLQSQVPGLSASTSRARLGGQRYHPEWQLGQADIAAAGGAGRRSAKIADAPMNQSREAHLPARPLHSPEGGSLRLLQVVADYIA
jgi:hypothetical protein